MDIEAIRSALEGGGSVFGMFSPYRDPLLSELIAATGVDFIVFDAEHGAIEAADMPALSLATEKHRCAALVRVPSLGPRVIGRYLDLGAGGIVAPMVNTEAQRSALLAASLFPPEGDRGLAATRSLDFGLGEPLDQKIADANTSTLLVAQIETRDAVDNLSAIMSDPRLDVVFVGPADLSTSLGHPLDFQHPAFLGALQKIATAAREHGAHLGALAVAPEQVAALHALGFRFFAGYIDQVLAKSCIEFAAGLRAAVSAS